MFLLYKNLILLLLTRSALGTISGLSYMDPMRLNFPLDIKVPGEDPCNPLYWYPRGIPEYCHFKTPVIVTTSENPPLPPLPPPLPIPVPVPLPPHPILPMPLPPPIMPLSPPMLHVPPVLPIAAPLPYNIYQSPLPPMQVPMSYGNPQLQFPQYPYPDHRPQAGFMPGLPGLVTKDGGINIMPFSDAYAEMLEKHKHKVIRKKLQRLVAKYQYLTNSRRNSRTRKFRRVMDSEEMKF